jgi:PIN domain nuclease of toxin-antitoxin system
MKLLLDTHIWLWYLLGDSRLSNHLQNVIDDQNNSLWLSPISIWETLLLAEKGKIILNPTTVQWIRNSQQRLPRSSASPLRPTRLEHYLV